MDKLNVNGFEICYVVDEGKPYFLAHDVAHYFGYCRSNAGRVNAVYQDFGIGQIQKHWKMINDGVKTPFYDRNGIVDFRYKSKKNQDIVPVKVKSLINEVNKIKIEKEPVQTKSKPSAKVAVQHVEVDEDKLVGSFVDGKIFNRKYKLKTVNDHAHSTKDCAISGKRIKIGDEVYTITVAKAGYGNYNFLRNELDKTTEEKVGWFRKLVGMITGR